MERAPDPQQIRAVFAFVMFLGDNLALTSQHFEDEVKCSPQELNVMRVLSLHGPLMVKDIAHAIPSISLNKLTRVLDSLETRGYVTRTLNREDRRSFLVSLTEPGALLFRQFIQHIDEVAQGILKPLTPTERLMLVELFAKIQANWHDAAGQENRPFMCS
jgi:DNA-binding MarR family transcriptional regulator